MVLNLNSGGLLSNAQNLTIPNTFNIGTATLSGPGLFTTPAGSITTMDDPTITNLAWLNQGIVNWIPINTSTSDFTLNTATFTNQGTLLLQNLNAGSTVFTAGGGTLINDVTGIINANPTTNLTISTVFTNNATTGFFNTLSGTTQLNNAANTNQGNINIGTGSTLQVGVGDALVLNTNTSFAGSLGTFGIAGGSVDVAALVDLSAAAMVLNLNSGGLLSNAQNLTIPNTFVIAGGTINGTGSFVTPASSNTVYSGASNLSLGVNWISNGIFNFASSSNDLDIQSTFNFTNSGTFNMVQTNAGANVIGAGSFTNTNSLFSGASVPSVISVNFTNSAGTIDIFSGSLSLGGAALTLGGGTLKGSGTFIGNVIADSGSTIAPGLSPGTLLVSGDVTFQAGSNFDVEIQSAAPGDYDVLNVTGNVNVATGANLNILGFGGYAGVLSDSFDVITATGTLTPAAGFTIVDDVNFAVTPTYTSTPDGLTLDVTSLNAVFNSWLGGSGNWLDDFNWSFGSVPSLSDDVFIDDEIAITVTLAGGIGEGVNTLTSSSLVTLNLTGSSLTISGTSVVNGPLNLDNSTLTVNGDLNLASLSMINSSEIDGTGTGTVSILNGLLMRNSDVRNVTDFSADTYTIQGLSQFFNSLVNHDGTLEITAAGDRLELQNTQMDSTSGSGTTEVTGAGTLAVLSGSNWNVNVSVPMAQTLTLDLDGGFINNIENLGLPGRFNFKQGNIGQFGVITIPGTTVFNYSASTPIAPNFNIVNNGIFEIETSAADIDLAGTNGAIFVNNGIFIVRSPSLANPTNVHLQSVMQNDGILDFILNSSLIVEPTGILNMNGSSVDGTGRLLVKGGLMNFTTPTALSSTIGLGLNTGSITGAQNLSVAGTFKWDDGLVAGGTGGTGFTTSGTVELLNGLLSTDWTVTPTGVVNWLGDSFNQLIITNATITNEGRFNIRSAVATGSSGQAQLRDTAGRDFSTSTGAVFINKGGLILGDLTGNNLDPIIFNLDFTNDGGSIGILSGTFKITDAQNNPVDLVLNNGSQLQGFGTFEGNVVNAGGVVTPGRDALGLADTGTLTVNGNFTQLDGGALNVNLDSTIGGLLNSELAVTGQMTAGGSINFNVINGKSATQLALLLDQSFTPISFGSFAGKFASVSVPAALNFSFSDTGEVTIGSSNQQLINISNQLEDLISRDELSFVDIVDAMRFIDRKVKVRAKDDEEDEDKRAPKLVCK